MDFFIWLRYNKTMWFILALLTAFFASLNDAFAKKFFSHLSHYEMAVFPMAYSLPFFLPVYLFIDSPPLDLLFYLSFLVSLPINGVAFILYMKAIKISPLSLTIPYLAFTPVFMVFTGFAFLGEVPGMSGLTGIIMICMGGYVLNLDLDKFTLLSPVRAVFHEKGSMIMLLVAFIFSFAAVIGKVGILHSSPVYFSVSFFMVFNLVMFFLLLAMKKISVGNLLKYKFKGLLIGGAMFFHALFHCLSIALAKAAYMISIKRLSILFSVIYGGVFFDEKNIRMRIAGALLMFLGSVMILLGE